MEKKDELKICIFDILYQQEHLQAQYNELQKQKEIKIKELHSLGD